MRQILLFALLTILPTRLSAQFYYSGRGSAKIKWEQIDTKQYRLLYPQGFSIGAQRYASILDSIYPYVNYNFSKPIRKIPIILRTESQYSNGYVVWAPKHEEIVTNPSSNTYALSWDKQVAIHEARHVAQMSLLKVGTTKVMTWLLGEAGISVGLLVVAKWQLEGDATLAETQMAEYGRGLQPEFTLGYRGLAADGKLKFKNLDPWVVGSYSHYVPDIYRFGYQLMSAAETYYSPTIWNDVVTYSAKYPFLISPRTLYLRHHYKTSYNKIAQRAFAELDSLWRPTYTIDNSFETLTPLPKLHTNYANPIPYGNSIISMKWDMKKPTRFIVLDTASGRERMLHSLGSVSSRPIISGDKIYWTEYKPNPIWEQKSSSAIRSMNLRTHKKEVYDRWGANFFVTPISGGRFATVRTGSQSESYIRITDSLFKTELSTYHFNRRTTLHSLTWDSTTEKLYYIALDDRGMWIGSLDAAGEIDEITAPSVVTVRDLKANGGVLYFSSIESGKDEIHTIDLSTGVQYRQTTSQLGSISPQNTKDSAIIFSSYTPRGWAIAREKSLDTLRRVEWSRLPQNILNPKRYKWEVPKIDTMQLSVDTSVMKREKRFRRALRSFNVHSWAPVSLDGGVLLGERNLSNLTFGASLFFQSTLSDMRGYATYGWLDDMNWVKVGAIYTGLPVTIELTAEYGGGFQKVYYPVKLNTAMTEQLNPYLGVSATFSLPLNLSKGANVQILKPSLTVAHTNARYYYMDSQTFGRDVRTYYGSLYWSSIMTKGYRSLKPRLGYAVQLTVNGALHRDFSTIINLTSRGYLPGFFQTHSLTVAGTAQYQMEWNHYKLTAKSLVPRGITNTLAAKNYSAFSSSYSMPLFYPEFGWDGMLFFRRVSAELFFDNSIGSYYTHKDNRTRLIKHYSGGVVINIDNNLFSTLSNTLSLTFARSTQNNFWFGLGVVFDM